MRLAELLNIAQHGTQGDQNPSKWLLADGKSQNKSQTFVPVLFRLWAADYDASMAPALTRRRDRRCRHEETWHICCGDVRVGMISERAGVPIEVEPWGWALGFYPGMEPPHSEGTAATFELARAAFEECWQQTLPTLTAEQFEAWRHDRDFRAEIRAKRARGEKLDTETFSSMMRCVCSVMFDSHKPEESYEHRRHIYEAQARGPNQKMESH